MNLWSKFANFENTVRAPLIIRAPWAQTQLGAKTFAIAEAVDIFPTFAELAGLSVPSSVKLDGLSLVRVLASNSSFTNVKHFAFSHKAKNAKSVDWESTGDLDKIETMGYSVRNDKWRLTEWVAWDNHSLIPLWGKQIAIEL